MCECISFRDYCSSLHGPTPISVENVVTSFMSDLIRFDHAIMLPVNPAKLDCIQRLFQWQYLMPIQYFNT